MDDSGKRRKLDPKTKSDDYIYVGSEPDSGIRVASIQSGMVTRVRNVRVIPTSFPYKERAHTRNGATKQFTMSEVVLVHHVPSAPTVEVAEHKESCQDNLGREVAGDDGEVQEDVDVEDNDDDGDEKSPDESGQHSEEDGFNDARPTSSRPRRNWTPSLKRLESMEASMAAVGGTPRRPHATYQAGSLTASEVGEPPGTFAAAMASRFKDHWLRSESVV